MEAEASFSHTSFVASDSFDLQQYYLINCINWAIIEPGKLISCLLNRPCKSNTDNYIQYWYLKTTEEIINDTKTVKEFYENDNRAVYELIKMSL